MDGERYLSELVAGYIRDIEALKDTNPKIASYAGGHQLGQAEAVGRAFVAAGLLQPQAFRDMIDPFKKLLLDRGVIQEVHGFASFSMESEAEAGAHKAEVENDGPYQRELRKVIPLARVFDLPEGRRVTLISLEDWSVGTTLNYEVQRPELTPQERTDLGSREHEPISAQQVAWEITDGVGTIYRKTDSGGSGGLRTARWELGLQPAVPSDAKTLTLVGHDRETVGELLRLTVDL